MVYVDLPAFKSVHQTSNGASIPGFSRSNESFLPDNGIRVPGQPNAQFDLGLVFGSSGQYSEI